MPIEVRAQRLHAPEYCRYSRIPAPEFPAFRVHIAAYGGGFVRDMSCVFIISEIKFFQSILIMPQIYNAYLTYANYFAIIFISRPNYSWLIYTAYEA